MTIRTITILSLLSTTAAFAETRQEEAIRTHRIDDAMPAVNQGLEISVAMNTAQTVGDIGNQMDANDIVGSAGELEFQIGYRVTPHLAIGFYSTAQILAEGSNKDRDIYSGSAGLEADFHFRPNHAVDPWISIGTGVRSLVIDTDSGTGVLVGAELARLQLGADFRLAQNVSLGPVIGASATLYGAEKLPMNDTFDELDEKGINWTLSAGLAGRFNSGF